MAAHHLSRRSMGLVKVLNQCFWNSCLHPLPSSVVRRTLGAVSCDSPTIFSSCRFGSTEAQKQQSYSGHDDEENFIQAMDFPSRRVTFTSEMRFISESPEKRVPCYRVLDENGNPIMHSSFVQGRYIVVWLPFKLWTPSSMKLRGKEEFPFMSPRMEKRLSTLHQLLHLLQMMLSCLSTGNLAFYYGVVSPSKNLPTNASGTSSTMGKPNKCQSIMGPISTISSLFHLSLLHSFLKRWALLILSKWIERMHALPLIWGMVAAVSRDGSPCYFHMPQQWMGHKHPHSRAVSKGVGRR